MTYSKLLSLSFLLMCIGLFSSCQEEETGFFGDPTLGNPIGNPIDFPKLPPSEVGSEVIEIRWLPVPMPCPRPRRMTALYRGGKQCDPGVLEIILREENQIIDAQVEIFTNYGGLYASSDKEYGGGLEAEGNRAEVYVPVVNDELAKQPLVQLTEISYVDRFGEERTESFKENFTFEQ